MEAMTSMSAPLLLAYICMALLFQLVAGIGIAVWARRRNAESTANVREAAAPPAPAGAWPGWRDFRIARREYADAARSQCSFYLEPVDGAPLPAFRPGQFLTFALEIADARSVARTVTRCYSLSDLPDPSRYRVTVKRVPAGMSSNYFHDALPEGTVVRVKAPSGRFCIDADLSVPVVLVAGGIGITPMMSMLRWCLAEQPARAVHLYYGVRNSADHAFKAVLEALAHTHPNFHLQVAYSRATPQDKPGRDFQHAGHVNVDLLRRTLPQGRHRFYVCGPPAMMESLVPALAEWGVSREGLHFEAFGPASVSLAGAVPDAAPDAAAAFDVQFRLSGRTLLWDRPGETLLDFAERNGVAIESGCRSGGCGTCETKLVSGTVRYASVPDHDVAPGHCLLCVARPATALVLEA
jgi:ferredoxin-NADP reductase